jgi:ubiquinone/menaquinone biosynthesis C-methylase UbiE
MGELNLLEAYPRGKRNIAERSTATPEDRALAKKFGKEYFDGTRNQGYGGYQYDGRWKPVARRLAEHYGLKAGDSVLDVGSGKGFLLHDLLEAVPGLSVAGVDISEYGVANTMEEVKPFVQVGDIRKLPYPDRSFELVLAINVIHNLKGNDLIKAIKEIERVSRKHKYVIVDSYRTEEERERVTSWVLTAETILDTKGWAALFKKAGYTGDYFWFIP